MYNSDEFNLKTSELEISLKDAINKYCEYKFANDSIIKLTIIMDYIIIYDDNYIFPNTYYNLKTGIYNLSGFWINGNTGIIKEVRTKEYIKVLIDCGLASGIELQIKYVTRDDFVKQE